MKYAIVTLTPNEGIFNRMIKSAGKNTEDFIYLSLSDSAVSNIKTAAQLRPYAFELKGKLELLANTVDIIITAGAAPTKALLGNVALTKVVNTPIKHTIGSKEFTIIPTFDMDYASITPTAIDDIMYTFRALEFVLNPTFGVSKPEIRQIVDETTLKEALIDFQDAEKIGYDVETGGESNDKEIGLKLFSVECKPLTVAFSTDRIAYWVNVGYDDNAHPEYALTLLKAFKDRLVMHNRSFDVLATQQLLHFKMNCVQDDTLLMSFLFDENTNHGLKVLAAKHLGWYNYAENVKDAVSESLTSNFGVVPLNELGEYNCLDAAATWHLYYEYDKRLDTAEKELYKFLLQAQNMYIEATTNGFPVDLTYLGRLKSELENEKADLEVEINSAEEVTTAKKLIALASAGIIDKEALYKEGKIVRISEITLNIKEVDKVEFNVASSRHLIALMVACNYSPKKKTKTNNISTDASVLETIDHEVFRKIKRVKEINTILNTFITGLMDYVYPDGKIHPLFSLTGTVTGRTSCQKINIQQIPRDKRVKNFFYAPEGYKIVQFDFAQAEVRVMASFSKDENLINAIISGTDIHRAVAASMFNKEAEEISASERQAAKACTFGIVYGIGPNKLADQIKSTKEDAQDKLTRFMTQFPKVKQWIDNIHRSVRVKGYVSTPLGRKRHLPTIWVNSNEIQSEARRQAQNSPVQATASDLALWLLIRITKNMNKEKGAFVASVHDSGVFIIHDSYITEFIELMDASLDALNRRFTFLKVPMKLDISVGTRWGTMDACVKKDGVWTIVKEEK